MLSAVVTAPDSRDLEPSRAEWAVARLRNPEILDLTSSSVAQHTIVKLFYTANDAAES